MSDLASELKAMTGQEGQQAPASSPTDIASELRNAADGNLPTSKSTEPSTEGVDLPTKFLRGATLGGFDYINAGARYIAPLIDHALGIGPKAEPITYEQALEQERAAEKAYAEKNPISTGAAELAGGITSPILGKLAKGISLLGGAAWNVGAPLAGLSQGIPRYLDYALQGGGIGSLGGLASAESQAGGLPATSDLLSSAAHGSGYGAVLGTAIPGAVELGGRAALKIIPDKILDRFSENPGDQGAARAISKALSRDKITTQDVNQRLQELGPQATLADVSPNMTGLAETVAQRPGEGASNAQQVLQERQEGQGARLSKAVQDNLSDQKYFDTLDELRKQRSATAQPLRQSALDAAEQAPPVKSDTINRMIARPSVRSGIIHGIDLVNDEIARTGEGIPIDKTWFEDTSPTLPDYETALLQKPSDHGISTENVEIRSEPTLRILDAAKQGLGANLEKFRNPITKKIDYTPDAVNAEKNLFTFTDELKQMYPGYADYLNAWAGPSQMMKSVNMGRDMVGRDPEMNARIIQGMSDSDKEFARVGMAKELQDMIVKTPDGANAAQRLIGSKAKRDALQPLFPDDASFQNFMTAAQNEIHFSRVRNQVLGNSRTMARAAGNADLEGAEGLNTGGVDIGPAAISFAAGNHGEAALQLAKSLGNKYLGGLTGPSEAAATTLGQHLFSQDQIMQRKLLDLAMQLPQKDAQRLGALSQRVGSLPSPAIGALSTLMTGGSNQ